MDKRQDLSFSLCLDKSHGQKERLFSDLRPCINNSWTPDHTVDRCYQCHTLFNLYYRKHHCRSCGRIFCSNCTLYKVSLPRCVEIFPEDPSGKYLAYSPPQNPKPESTLNMIGGTISRLGTYLFPEGKTSKNNIQVRVCTACFKRIEQIYHLKIYLWIFSYLSLPDIYKFSRVCKNWNTTSNICKSLLRDIQYTIPGSDLTLLQKRLFWNNREYFVSHSRWIVHLLSRFEVPDWYMLLQQKKVKCWSLMCTRTCSPEITGYEAIELLVLRSRSGYLFLRYSGSVSRDVKKSYHLNFSDLQSNDSKNDSKNEDPNPQKNPIEKNSHKNPENTLYRYLLSRVDTLSDEEIEVFLPNLTLLLIHDVIEISSSRGYLLKLLLKRARTNLHLRILLYWNFNFFRGRYPEILTDFKIFVAEMRDLLGEDQMGDQLTRGYSLMYSFLRMKSDPDALSSMASCNLNPILNPLNCKYKITNVKISQIKQKDSSSSPTLIPLDVIENNDNHDNHQNDQNHQNPESKLEVAVLLKRESVLKDYLVLNIIRLMDIILKKWEKTDFYIQTYQVLPIDDTSGFIEILPSTETLYTISNEKKTSLLNYLLENNRHLPAHEVRERFIRSVAAYSVISYLLGVGDRHLDNIMITRDGYLFHIDYGYILGRDPKPITPSIRVTQDIVDAMGGSSSDDFNRFKQYSTQIYTCLRKHMSIFYTILSLLSDLKYENNRYTPEYISKEILSRFIPHELSTEAESQLLFKIDSSYSSYTPRMFDFVHSTVKSSSLFSIF